MLGVMKLMYCVDLQVKPFARLDDELGFEPEHTEQRPLGFRYGCVACNPLKHGQRTILERS